MNTRILLVDDHGIMRGGLRALLEKESGLEVVGEAGDGREAVRLAEEIRPDIVIMDIAMRGLNGIDAARQILALAPKTKLLALSMHADRRYVAEMLQAGAMGYVLKDCAYEELARAVHEIMAGRTFFSTGISGAPVQAEAPPDLDRLSGREREVLQLIAEGCSTREVAGRLHVSVKTIETHRAHIMVKLGVRSVAELTKIAVREGLTSLSG